MVHFNKDVLKLQLKNYFKNKKYKDLKAPTKDSTYHQLLKLLSVLYDFKQNFLYDITNFFYDEQTGILTLDGWALTKNEKLPVNIDISGKQGEIVKFTRTNNLGALEEDQYNPDEKYGFHLEIKLPKNADRTKFNLILKNKVTDEIVPITARADKPFHYAPIEFYEYYDLVRRTKGVEHMEEVYELQNDRPWDAYNQWFHFVPQPSAEEARAEIEAFEKKPKISIVVPVYNVEEQWLRRMIDTVRGQVYENWELCLADDASPSEHVKRVLSEYASLDPRIKFISRKENGHISEATNSALDLATGDYIGFMDHDDELEPLALYEVVKAINENEGADFIYTDQDFIDTTGHRSEPFFKNNWNPRLLQSQNYISHFDVVSRDLLNKTGRLRSKFDGSQDYDFILRATDNANKIVHIPKILYHWRLLQGSVAEDPEAKKYAYVKGAEALTERLRKKGINGKAVPSQYYGIYDLIREDEPSVSVIIVSNNTPEADETLRALAEDTDYSNYQIVAVNFDENLDYPNKEKIKFIWNNAPISEVKLLDFAVKNSDGEYLAFVEPGVYPDNKDWLKNMVNETINEENGIIGTLIVDETNTVLNAGMQLDTASDQILYCHKNYLIKPEYLGYYFRLIVPQNVPAVSSACVMMSRELYNELEGFSEGYDRPTLDIDTSIRAARLGKKTVWTPRSKMIWKGNVEAFPTLDNSKETTFYKEAVPEQVADLLSKYNVEEFEDPYTQDLIIRYRRLSNPDYSGPEELRYV